MARSSQAYDLSVFENRIPKVRVTQNKAPKPKRQAPIVKVLCFALAIFLMAGFIYSRSKLTEITQEIGKANQELKILESEKTRLDMELAGSVSLQKIEDYAVNELGLIKLTKQQTIYVSTASGNKGEVAAKSDSMLQKIKDVLSDFTDFIGL